MSYPEILYHYTSVSGLMGIVNEASIRATHISYLNDRAEMEVGRARLALALSEKALELSETPIDRAEVGSENLGVAHVITYIRAAARALEATTDEQGPYVTSFTGSSQLRV